MRFVLVKYGEWLDMLGDVLRKWRRETYEMLILFLIGSQAVTIGLMAILLIFLVLLKGMADWE